MPLTVQVYLNTLFDVLSNHYVNTKNVDWKTLKATAEASAQNAQTTEDLVPIVRQVLETIGDDRIGFEDAEVIKARSKRDADGYVGFNGNDDLVLISVTPGGPMDKAGARVGDGLEAIDGEPPRYSIDGPFEIAGKRTTITVNRNGEILDFTVDRSQIAFDRPLRAGRLGPAAYLETPITANGNYSREASSIQTSLRLLEASGACGWVIDARRDQGSALGQWAGFGPLIGEKILTYQTNSQTLPWTYNSSTGSLLYNSLLQVVLFTKAFVPKHPNAPVAILIGPNTNPFMPAAFIGRENTITAGHAIPGEVYESEFYDLEPSKQSNINFPSARILDRNGNVVKSVKPDVMLETNWVDFGTKRDAVIQAVLDWLRAQPACK